MLVLEYPTSIFFSTLCWFFVPSIAISTSKVCTSFPRVYSKVGFGLRGIEGGLQGGLKGLRGLGVKGFNGFRD